MHKKRVIRPGSITLRVALGAALIFILTIISQTAVSDISIARGGQQLREISRGGNGSGLIGLPTPLMEFLTENFSHFKIPDQETFDPVVTDLSIFGESAATPAVCTGDFNADGRSDICVILDGERLTKIIAFHQEPNGDYQPYLIKQGLARTLNGPSGRYQYIDLYPSGQAKVVELTSAAKFKTRVLKLEHQGIRETLVGRVSILYYFEEDGYKKYTLSETALLP